MFKTIVFGLVMSVFAVIANFGSWAQAQPGVYSAQLQADWYGNGTHEYYHGNFAEAIMYFSTAISVNPNDPRAYFYRGLAKLHCGSEPSATADFQQGAFREAYRSGRASSAVNRSLERIQGASRLEIERYRREARLAYHMRSNIPASDTPPVMFGDMVDVDSIAPIIKQVIPPQTAPGQAQEPAMIQPSEDIDRPLPENREPTPAEVVPQPEEQNGLPQDSPKDFAPPPPPDDQPDDPFGG